MTICKRKNGFKQFLALLVVFTLVCPGALSARKEKHGAWLKVTKQDAQVVEGELLKVTKTEIILMSLSESENTIPIGDVKIIEYQKKGKFLTGAAIGLGLSAIAGGIIGHQFKNEGIGTSGGVIVYGAILGIPSGLLFGLISSKIKKHKTLNFENASPPQILINIEKLKALARY